jgi:hypothetical protein
MRDDIFEDCKQYWLEADGNPFWQMLADKHDYSSKEAIRKDFGRECHRKGISRDESNERSIKIDVPVGVRVGVVDVETLPIIAPVFGIWDVNINPMHILKESCLLSWAGKFILSDNVYSDVLTGEEAIARDSKRITNSLAEFLEQCDIVVGQNFRNYDSKVINTEFLLHGIHPIRYRMIDTLEVLKNNFRFVSNKMLYVNKRLDISEKIDNDGMPLWIKCNDGDEESLEKMLAYNVGDIVSSEDLFWRVQPFINNMPHLSAYNTDLKEMSCACGSTKIEEVGLWTTNSAIYKKYRCKSCHALMRGRENLMPKSKRMLMPVRL